MVGSFAAAILPSPFLRGGAGGGAVGGIADSLSYLVAPPPPTPPRESGEGSSRRPW
jgi:hypothetical protein